MLSYLFNCFPAPRRCRRTGRKAGPGQAKLGIISAPSRRGSQGWKILLELVLEQGAAEALDGTRASRRLWIVLEGSYRHSVVP